MIKLPVRVEEYFEEYVEFVDAEGQPVVPEGIAAAMNAAPKRAFEGLTLTEFTLMAAKHNKRSGIDLKGLFDDLQAFAAPVAAAWREIENLPLPREFVYLQPKDRRILTVIAALREQEYQVAAEPTFECRDGHIYNLDYFTHWQPLPAAPEAQGRGE